MHTERARQDRGSASARSGGGGGIERWRGEEGGRRRATELGWLSIGLGLTQLLSPARLGRVLGVGDSQRAQTALQLLGVCEIAAGVGLLSRRDDAAFLWARAFGAPLDNGQRTPRQAAHATHSITVARPVEEVRRAWEQLPVAAPLRDQGHVDIHAAPGGQGTEVSIELFQDPPSAAREVVENIFSRGPGSGAGADLRRFKQMLEVGEIVQSDASLHARPHAAQPSPEKSGKSERLVAR